MPWDDHIDCAFGPDDTWAISYIRHGYEPEDRLAVVLVNKSTQSVIQRIVAAEKITSRPFMEWLHYKNLQHYEVYISMNPLEDQAQGRTKTDVARINHVYLDFDKDGIRAIQAIERRPDLPLPSFVLHTSPGKTQAIWRVEGFAKSEAEDLQKHLAHELGADPAATDCSRVLRMPGFYNHKYGTPHFVGAEARAALNDLTYTPSDFPSVPSHDKWVPPPSPVDRALRASTGRLSQSEYDWAFARRALSRGEPVASIIAAIAEYRRNDKPDPQYYAAHTVQKAATSLAREQLRGFNLGSGPEH